MTIAEIESAGYKVTGGKVTRVHNMQVFAVYLIREGQKYITWTFTGCKCFTEPEAI